MKRLSAVVFGVLLIGITAGIILMEGSPEKVDLELASPRDLAPGPEDVFYVSSILQVWEPLFTSENGTPVGKLVDDWFSSEDATEWTFRLRQGITFHDGTPLTAETVRENFRRYRQLSPAPSQFYVIDIDELYPGLESFEVVSELEFRLTFDRPQPLLAHRMVGFSSAILSPSSFDDSGRFTGPILGTGPFKLTDRRPDRWVQLERYDEYWGEPARIRDFRVKVIPDANTRATALRSGEVDGVVDVGSLPHHLVSELTRRDDLVVSSHPSTISHYLVPNGTRSPFNRMEYRQALSQLLDRELLARELFGSQVVPTDVFLNHETEFSWKTEPIRGTESAGRVLESIDEELKLLVSRSFTERYPYRQLAEYLQAQLGDLGVNLNVIILDGPAFNAAVERGDFHLLLRIQGLPNLDPLPLFERFFHSEGSTNQRYNLGYHNPAVDELIDRARNTVEVEDLRSMYREVQQIVRDEMPIIPLFHDNNLLVHRSHLVDFHARTYTTTLETVEVGNSDSAVGRN